MYRIYLDNKVVGMTDKPNYVYRHSDGYYVLCDEAEAQGVAVDGTVYALQNRQGIEAPAVIVVQEDSGRLMTEQNAQSGIVFVTLAESNQIDDVTAGEHIDLFEEWQPSISYKAGQLRTSGGKLYRCLQAHTSQIGWEPENVPSLWKLTADPSEEWPEWSQPIGAGDAYNTGDRVTHNGKRWTSDYDNNVWEPGVFGWTEVAE